MSERVLIFGGETVPAHIGFTPHIIRAPRKMTATPIQGSNIEVVDMQDAWECYDQPYSLYVGDGTDDCVQPMLDEVARVLSKKGWQTLVDDYEPEIFRLAYYKGGFDAENRYTRLGKFDITFRCRPERFLNSGTRAINVSTGDVLTNPTSYEAHPLIHITGEGSGTLTVGGKTMSFTGITDYLNIDCEKQDVYRLPSENMNSHASGEFPVLNAGNNTVTFTGGILSVTITPRYYVI